jgi:hypothetical protein
MKNARLLHSTHSHHSYRLCMRVHLSLSRCAGHSGVGRGDEVDSNSAPHHWLAHRHVVTVTSDGSADLGTRHQRLRI